MALNSRSLSFKAIGLNCGPQGGLTRVRELFHSDSSITQKSGGALEIVDYRDAYRTYSANIANVTQGSLSGLRVVLDGFHGSAGPEHVSELDLGGSHRRCAPTHPERGFSDRFTEPNQSRVKWMLPFYSRNK